MFIVEFYEDFKPLKHHPPHLLTTKKDAVSEHDSLLKAATNLAELNYSALDGSSSLPTGVIPSSHHYT